MQSERIAVKSLKSLNRYRHDGLVSLDLLNKHSERFFIATEKIIVDTKPKARLGLCVPISICKSFNLYA